MLAKFAPMLLAVVLLSPTLYADEISGDLKKLQGTWQVTKGVIAGREASRDNAEDSRLIFGGNTMTFESSRESNRATVSVDGSKKPATLDAEVLDGDEKGKKRLAIYELDGDVLKMAWSRGDKRPEKLESSTGSDVIYLELRRIDR